MAVSILTGVGDEVLITVCCGALLALAVGFFSFKRSASQTTNNGQDHETQRAPRTYNNEQCPICLSPHRLAVETNCGHKFCGLCIKDYVNMRPYNELSIFNGRLSCPMCRQDITILLLSFSQEEMTVNDIETERIQVETAVHEFNIRQGYGYHSLWSYITDSPVLVRHLMTNFFSDGGLVWMFRLRVIVCFLAAMSYLFFPIDIIPESVFGLFGLVDDVIVFILCVIYISTLYRRYLLSR